MAQSDPLSSLFKLVLLFGGAYTVGKAFGGATAPTRRLPSNPGKPSWRVTEESTCKALGKPHMGGPGRPDCAGGVEVKDWATPVHAGVIAAEAKKGRKIIYANEFTGPARDTAKRLGVKLRRLT